MMIASKKISISVKSLKTIAVLYLAVPFFLFFGTWLELVFSVPLCLILLYCTIQFRRKLTDTATFSVPLFQVILSLIVAFLWVGISGNGCMGLQWNDLIKPLAISKDIVTQDGPILYRDPISKEYFLLCQYMSFYLTVPTLLGFLPWNGLLFAMFLYTYSGVVLGLVWFWHLSGTYSPIVTLFFIFFCGIDFIGFAYSAGLKNAFLSLKNDFFAFQPFWGNTMIDAKMPFMYQSNTHSLFWGPQHAIATWMGTGMFLYDFLNKKDLESSPFYLALLIFLSPFIVLGILPFLLFAAIQKGILKFFSIENLLMIPIVAMIVWYLSSLPLGTINSGFIFYKSESFVGYLQQIKAFLIFWVADVGVWITPVLIFFFRTKNKEMKNLALLTALTLTFVPFYRFGVFNDWAQRVSMPALFITAILVVKVFMNSKIWLRLYLIFIFCLGAWDPIYFVSNSLKLTGGRIKFMPKPYDETPTYYKACEMSNYPIYQNMAPISTSFYQIACKKNQ